MRIYRRGKYWWVEFRFQGRHVRKTSHSDNRNVAERLLRKLVAECETGTFSGSGDKITFEQIADLMRSDYEINGRTSMETVEFSIKRLAQAFGGERVVKITADRIERYKIERIRDGAAKATVNRELNALSKMFRLAVDRELIARRPKIKLFDCSDSIRQGFVTKAQYEAIRVHLPEWMKDPADWMFLTGMRSGAVKYLERRDYEPSRSVLHVRPEISKNREGIEIPLFGHLAIVIERAISKVRLDCPYLFHRDGHRLPDMHWAWRKATTAAGFPNIIPHDLRRSAVRNMSDAGIDEQVAMTISGHKTREVYRRYRIVTMDNRRRAIEKLTDYLDAQPTKVSGGIVRAFVPPSPSEPSTQATGTDDDSLGKMQEGANPGSPFAPKTLLKIHARSSQKRGLK